MTYRTRLRLQTLLVLVGWLPAIAFADEAKELDAFFETSVRPVLVEHCQSCHGAKKQEAGLRLDSAAGLKNGSDSGAVVVPGDVEQSLLIQAVRHTGNTKMPPKQKLSDAAIAALTKWVKLGAVWPVDAVGSGADNGASIRERTRAHWAFQPVRLPMIPQVADAVCVTTPIDAFVLAKLEQAGLKPSPRADRRTLIRRATFDLHGLPPTPDEVAAFVADDSPLAFEKLVNRLLESPRYGERWGRHWLDVARYSDTKGYVRLADNPLYPAAWTYRDYVIRAFNNDLPYDQFVVQQLAADQLDLGDDPRPLAALGFLTLGQRFINSPHDIIDDRIDVVTRGLLGLTVACARCHDHKFDAVPTRDYYGLHGVFASSLEPHVLPLIVPKSELAPYAGYLNELEKRTAKLQQFLVAQQTKFETGFRVRIGEYLLAGQKEEVQANFLPVMFLIDASKDLNPAMTQRWARFLEATRKQHHPVLACWHELARLSAATPDEFAAQSVELTTKWRGSVGSEMRLNQVVVEALAASPPRQLSDVAQRYAELFQQADARWQQSLKTDPAVSKLPDRDWEELRQLLYGAGSPPVVPLTEVEEFLFVDATTQNQFHQQQRLVEDWIASPGAAPHAHVLLDAALPANSRVFVRGNASNPGVEAPRQFLDVLTRGERRAFQHGSGRLELARAIADRDNPLTARVFVNRVWQQHFGAGLVRTSSDFGLRSEPPTHPELLDYLASQFVENGWSIKTLHRLVMRSAVYQQRSGVSDGQLDPENRLLSRMNRRRLDWESLRDSLLAVSGQLDLTPGGPSVKVTTPPFSARRSVYGFIDRQDLPSVLRTFDFAPPDTSNALRHQTTVPQQALFLLNSPFLKEQTRLLAARPDLLRIEAPEARIDAVYRRLFGRAAEAEEIAIGRKFLETAGKPASEATHLTAWEEYLQTLLLSNEFVFVD